MLHTFAVCKCRIKWVTCEWRDKLTMQRLYCSELHWSLLLCIYPCPPLDNIWVMVIVWRLRANIIITALCRIVWYSVHSPQHTYLSSSYRSNRLGLSNWDPYAVRRGSCLELYYCNMVEWFWWDSSLISTTNWFPLVLWHCWFGHLACKKSSTKWPIMCWVGR